MSHCTGVKACEFLDPEIRDLHHYEAGVPLFVKMEDRRKELLAQEVDSQPLRQSLGYVYYYYQTSL